MPKATTKAMLTTAQDSAATEPATGVDSPPTRPAKPSAVKPPVRRGRPLGSGDKVQVTIRLSIDVVERLKATGPGWQTRANDALRHSVGRGTYD